MIIIVESGATRADWCGIGADASLHPVQTAGMNLATMAPEAIRAIVEAAAPALNPAGERVTALHFYAAGLLGGGAGVPESAKELDRVLRGLFPEAEISYASDLLAAARAVCGHESGIAAILGTGSNSGLYDGTQVVRNVRSGGFILGDEGSAAVLGRLFLADFLKERLPQALSDEFAATFPVDYMSIVQNVYKAPAPSRYLGGFAPFILAHYGRVDYVTELVEGNFRSFIERALMPYDPARYSVGVVGGFGYACRDILRRVAAEYGIRFSTIIAAPMEGLIAYHRNLPAGMPGAAAWQNETRRA